MHKIAMLGTGLIGRFYTMSLQNFPGKDEMVGDCFGRARIVIAMAFTLTRNFDLKKIKVLSFLIEFGY